MKTLFVVLMILSNNDVKRFFVSFLAFVVSFVLLSLFYVNFFKNSYVGDPVVVALFPYVIPFFSSIGVFGFVFLNLKINDPENIKELHSDLVNDIASNVDPDGCIVTTIPNPFHQIKPGGFESLKIYSDRVEFLPQHRVFKLKEIKRVYNLYFPESHFKVNSYSEVLYSEALYSEVYLEDFYGNKYAFFQPTFVFGHYYKIGKPKSVSNYKEVFSVFRLRGFKLNPVSNYYENNGESIDPLFAEALKKRGVKLS